MNHILDIHDEPAGWDERHDHMLETLRAAGIERHNPLPSEMQITVALEDVDGDPIGVALLGLASIESA